MKLCPALFLFCLTFISTRALSQDAKPAAPPPQALPALITPEVHSDDSVTFRFRAPNAQDVKLAREGTQPVAMQKDENGVWTVNTRTFAAGLLRIFHHR